MASTYQGSMKLLEPIEGGYAKAYANAGETYRGIDRKQNPRWRGWALIDNYKKKYGPIKERSYLVDPNINTAVAEFYSQYWKDYGMDNLTHPVLCAIVWALIVHRATNGVNQVNLHAKQYGAKVLNAKKITPDAALAIQRNLPGSYATLRTRLINYYQSFTDPKKQAYINNRVLIFPASLTGNAAPSQQNSPLENFGLLFTIAKLIF